MTQLTDSILNAALEGLEVRKQRIDAHIAEIRAMLGGAPAPATASSKPELRPRRAFSKETRLKMAMAQRRRQAALRGEAVSGQPQAKKQTGKRRLSPEGLANIRAGVARRVAATKKAAASA